MVRLRAGFKWSQWHKLIAEQNLLNIKLTNRNVNLTLVNNRTAKGDTPIKVWASTKEWFLRETREGESSSDVAAARATAQLFGERAVERGYSQVTWLRPKGVAYSGKVKAIIETLREAGINFVSHANAVTRAHTSPAPPKPTPTIQYVRRANTGKTGRYQKHVPEPPYWRRAASQQ